MRWPSGRVVVATTHADTELGCVVQACGMTCRSGRCNGVCNAIRSLARDPLRRALLAGRRYVELCLGMDGILSRFEQVLQGIV